MRYRYIIGGFIEASNPISKDILDARPLSDYRLISHREIGKTVRTPGNTYIRVVIPKDMVLHKCWCDNYSTTEDTRTISELGYDIMITMWDGKRKVLPKDTNIIEAKDEQYLKWSRVRQETPEKAYKPILPENI